MNNSEIQIFTTKDGKIEIEVQLDNETVWLNQYQLESLFETDRTSVNRHISNIFKTKELEEKSTCAKIAQVQKNPPLITGLFPRLFCKKSSKNAANHFWRYLNGR